MYVLCMWVRPMIPPGDSLSVDRVFYSQAVTYSCIILFLYCTMSCASLRGLTQSAVIINKTELAWLSNKTEACVIIIIMAISLQPLDPHAQL